MAATYDKTTRRSFFSIQFINLANITAKFFVAQAIAFQIEHLVLL